jgi:hypothetical protein
MDRCWAYTARCLDDGAFFLGGEKVRKITMRPQLSDYLNSPFNTRLNPHTAYTTILGRQHSLFVLRVKHTHLRNGM